MSSLTDKLKDLGVQVGTEGISPAKKKQSKPNLVDHFPGSWEQTVKGECFVVRKTIPGSVKHGSRQLSGKLSLSVFETIPALTGISKISSGNILYIDTETTGLAGGAGTYVFLIGAAKVVQDQIEFAQFFLQDPANESAQLAAFESFAADSKIIVSYNGKSFDLPRIRNRYLFHGWPTPFQDIFHLDLLHIARRLWKDHLPGCTLGDLEFHLLELVRSDKDIPGWKVSERFFEYLQNQDPEPLEKVFYHNEIDVLSLVALLSYISERLSDPLTPSHQNSSDLVSFGKYFIHLHQDELALEILSAAVRKRNLSSDQKIAARAYLASLHKKNSEYTAAVKLWKKNAAKGDIPSKIELAKYYEHREKDLDEAIHWTLSAKSDLVDKDRLHDLLSQRLTRLKQKSENRKK
jgi:uncharacterized protein YprB with RNaseH-like and TPR domain